MQNQNAPYRPNNVDRPMIDLIDFFYTVIHAVNVTEYNMIDF